MNAEIRTQFPEVQVYDRNGQKMGNHISKTGGLINLSNGYADSDGFYISVAPSGTEGLLKVVPFTGDPSNPVVLPFYKGFDKNPVLLQAVVNDAGNTATVVYWGK